MGKYCGGITIDEACERECEGVKETLKKYKVSEADLDEVLEAIEEGYFQAKTMSDFVTAVTEAIKSTFDISDGDIFRMIVRKPENPKEQLERNRLNREAVKSDKMLNNILTKLHENDEAVVSAECEKY